MYLQGSCLLHTSQPLHYWGMYLHIYAIDTWLLQCCFIYSSLMLVNLTGHWNEMVAPLQLNNFKSVPLNGNELKIDTLEM